MGLPTISSLKKRCDNWFSKKIRLLYADGAGFVVCYTCGARMFWKNGQAQCGHYVSRQYNSLRYHEKNAKVQCMNCNVWRRGNYSSYVAHLVRDEGAEILEWFEIERKKMRKFAVRDLLKLEEQLKKEVETLLINKNLTDA